MFKIDTRHLLAAVTVADEGSLSRAAIKLHITQSAVSKQILSLERFLGHGLFHRHGRTLQTTPAGVVFVQHARYALSMQDRAVHLSREAFLEEKDIILLGKSPYTDPFFMTALAAIQRSMFPDLRIDVQSNFTPELSRQLVAGVLDLVVMTEGSNDAQISSLALDESPFYVLLQDRHVAAKRRAIRLKELDGNVLVRFARHLNPDLYDRLTHALDESHAQPSAVHHVTTAEEAAHLVYGKNGIALLTRHGAWRVLEEGLTMRPLLSGEVLIRTVLAVKSDVRSPLITRLVKEVGKRLSPGGQAAARCLEP